MKAVNTDCKTFSGVPGRPFPLTKHTGYESIALAPWGGLCLQASLTPTLCHKGNVNAPENTLYSWQTHKMSPALSSKCLNVMFTVGLGHRLNSSPYITNVSCNLFAGSLKIQM